MLCRGVLLCREGSGSGDEEADEAAFRAVGAEPELVGEALEIRSRLAAHRRRDTLYQRIDRISAHLGPQWRHGDQKLQVHLALTMHRTAG